MNELAQPLRQHDPHGPERCHEEHENDEPSLDDRALEELHDEPERSHDEQNPEQYPEYEPKNFPPERDFRLRC